MPDFDLERSKSPPSKANSRIPNERAEEEARARGAIDGLADWDLDAKKSSTLSFIANRGGAESH